MLVLAVDGSPTGAGKTQQALRAVLKPAELEGHETRLSSLAGEDIETCLAAIREADAVVFGTPIHRASHAAPLKELLDRLPRGMWGEKEAPITGRAVAIVATGATDHHHLGIQDLRNVLSGFFAAFVVPPGLYLPASAFTPIGPSAEAGEQAREQGRGLIALAEAIASDSRLSRLHPYV